MRKTVGLLLAAFVGLCTSCSNTSDDSEATVEVAEIGLDEASQSESFPDAWKSFSATDVELLQELKTLGDSRCECATSALEEQGLLWMVDTLQSLTVLVQRMSSSQGVELEAVAKDYKLRSQQLENFSKQIRAAHDSPCGKQMRARSEEIEHLLMSGKRSKEEEEQLGGAYNLAISGVASTGCPWAAMIQM